MSGTKRAWKLQEFVAHASNVNCLALGHKTGRVMVTGGDDKKVNLWTVGKPNCIMSLSGHTSPVEAVRFGNAEEVVVAGSMSGALKLWDLEAAKIVRTLTGHKANIRCLDFHPYGDFVASGSLDTNVKLWDIRRKGCIFTYKGHTNSVNSMRFSPDGRWIASAGEDSTIKIWDLAAGKLLVDLRQHSGPVNSIEFHPSEYLLASGSSDRTIRFWELEKFQCVDCTDFDNNGIRNVVFHPDGQCIFGGSQDIMKVYGWEPSRCFDSVSVGWGKLIDLAMASTQLIGATFNQTNVATYVIDLTRVAPVGEAPQGVTSPPMSASGRRSFQAERPPTTSTKQQIPKPAEEPEDSAVPTDDAGDDSSSTADVKDPKEYEQFFKANLKLAHSPPKKMDPFPAPKDDDVTSVAQNFKAMPSAATPSTESQRPEGLNPNDFLPPQMPGRTPAMSDTEALHAICKGHNSMSTLLTSRTKNLQIVRAMWSSGNVKTALESALQMNDLSVIVDILGVLNYRPNLWNLDVIALLIPNIKNLIVAKYESYVHVGCSSLKLVLKNFSQLIRQNLTPPNRLGVDITGEERHKKCVGIYRLVNDIRQSVEGKQYQQGKIGSTFKELQLLMSSLDT